MKTALLPLICLASAALAASATARADTLQELTQRVEELERQQEESARQAAENARTVRSFLDDRLALGGFFETGVTEFHGPDTEFQVAAASNTLGLNLAGEFNDRLRFSSQLLAALSFPLLNAENDPFATPGRRTIGTALPIAVLTQAYLEYGGSEAFQIQAGLGYVPFGHALQQRELVLFVRRGGPQLMRMASLAQALWNGVHAHGSRATRAGRIGYNLYTLTPLEDSRLLGAGGRAWWQSASEDVTLGLSSQRYRQLDRNSQVLGTDLDLKVGAFSVRSEYVRNFLSRAEDPWNVYVEPAISLGEGDWILYAFGDYAEHAQAKTGVRGDPFNRFETGGGVNWLPTSATRIRLGVYRFDYVGANSRPAGVNRDFWATDASVAVAF